MAVIEKMTIGIRLIPDDDTMKVILKLLNLWQDDNPNMMVAMVPVKDRYQYEIIERQPLEGEYAKHGEGYQRA